MMENEEENNHSKYNEYSFRSLLEHSDEGIVVLSLDGAPLYISPSIKKILGYSQVEVMKMDLITLMHPNDILPLSEVMEKVIANPGVTIKGHTGRMLHKNGSWRWIEATVTNLLDDPLVCGIVDNFRDVTEKRIAEEKLIHARQLYAFISQINQAIVRSTNEDDLFKSACRIAIEFGHFKVAWIGKINSFSRKIRLVAESGILPEDMPYFTDASYQIDGPQDQVLSTGNYYVCNDVQNNLLINSWKSYALKRKYASAIALPIKKSGEIIGTFNVYATEVEFFKEQEIALLVEATDDISYALDFFEKENLRRQAVAELQKSESNLSAIIENTDASIYSLDRSLCYITFNKSLKDSMQNVYGLEIKQGDKVYGFLEKIDPIEAHRWEMIYAQALAGETVKFEKEYVIGDSYSCMQFAIYPIESNEGIIGLSCFAIDITKQKAESIQKEKMVSDILKRNKNLEQFSYIVSHNLRSPITTIIGLTDLLQLNEYDDEESKIIDGIITSVKDLDNVIHDLNYVLQVSNPVNENKVIVKFSSLLSDIEKSISSLLKNKAVKIISDFSAIDEMLTIKSYIYSIFLNLITNSIKYNRHEVKSVIEITTFKSAETIELHFTDNGLGIDLTQNADKIFGLYNRFHNHTEGKGMGLYMVKMQVEALGGVISINSEVNKGTSFKIIFATTNS